MPKVFNFHQQAAIHYRPIVLNADGSVAKRYKWRRNMITDYGLDTVATKTWCNNFLYAVVGTGTTNPVKRDSGAITFTRAAAVVTSSSPFFAAAGADIGRLLKFDTGEEMYIVAPFIDTEHANVSVSGALAAAEGTIWYVNSAGLATETKRTNTYGSDSGDNGSTFSRPTWTHKRTFIFSAEAAPIVYNEIGWSNVATVSNNLFGRDIISGGVSLGAGQQLKVIVQLTVTGSPDTPVTWTNPATGWTQNGVHCIEGFTLSTVAGSGATVNGLMEVASTTAQTLFLATDSTALVNMTSSNNLTYTGDVGQHQVTWGTYTAGTFQRLASYTFLVSEGNSTAIRLIGFQGGANRRGYSVLLNAAETKDSSHTLQVGFLFSWQRTLIN